MDKLNNALIAAAVALILAACGSPSTTPDTDARFGHALATAKAQQTINPDASRNTNPVTGMDGRAAKGAMDNYRESFRKPPAEAASFLPIGAATAGTGATGR